MNPIGGYFELADREECRDFPHPNGIFLNTGRNALEFILQSIGSVKKVYLPFYTCDVVLEPLKRQGIQWQYYHINTNLEIAENIVPGQDEYVIVNNYFGVKDQYISQMAAVYGDHLIVDCAQAFFASVINGIKCFYSVRKFVGVADGGVAYPFNNKFSVDGLKEDDSSNHSDHLILRKEKGAEAGFATYREDEEKLNNQNVRKMSSYTKDILLHIDYKKVIEQRRKNYLVLESALDKQNLLKLPSVESFVSPMAYPLMIEDGVALRQKLIENKIFVPRFWPNESISEETVDGMVLSEIILPLPIDQRYGEDAMERIIEIVKC